MRTYSLLLPIRCPPLSSSPHPTLSLRLGESFLLCASPPCDAEAGGRTGAPFFLLRLSSPTPGADRTLALRGQGRSQCVHMSLHRELPRVRVSPCPLAALQHPVRRGPLARWLLSAPAGQHRGEGGGGGGREDGRGGGAGHGEVGPQPRGPQSQGRSRSPH